MGWPQYVVIALLAGSLGVAAAKHGEEQAPISIWTTMFSTIIWVILLTCGGFWK
jgi:hypothetical protein